MNNMNNATDTETCRRCQNPIPANRLHLGTDAFFCCRECARREYDRIEREHSWSLPTLGEPGAATAARA